MGWSKSHAGAIAGRDPPLKSPMLPGRETRAELRNGLVVRLEDDSILVETPNGRSATPRDFEALIDLIEKS